MTAHLLSVLDSDIYTSALIRILGQVPDEARRQSLADQRQYLGYWLDLLDDAAATGEIRSDLDLSAMLMMLMGALNWTVEWYDPTGRLDPEALAADLATVVLEGLSKRSPANTGRSFPSP
jgi:hypothetical protein